MEEKKYQDHIRLKIYSWLSFREIINKISNLNKNEWKLLKQIRKQKEQLMEGRVLKINLKRSNIIDYEILNYSMKLFTTYIVDIQRFNEIDSLLC